MSNPSWVDALSADDLPSDDVKGVENTEHMVTETRIRGMYRYWRQVMEA